MPHLIQRFPDLGIVLKGVSYVGDDPVDLFHALSCTRHSSIPIFCFGGIGATEDDRTRQVAADVFNRPLTRHGQAEQMIRHRFGEQAEPYRIRMADLPKGCGLIPNTVSQIPGFYHDGHYFLPGFPSMAQAMIAWIFENLLEPPGHPTVFMTSLWVTCKESQLVPIMETLTERFPLCRFFSLPSTQFNGQIELGFRSRETQSEPLAAMKKEMDAAQIPWSMID